MEHSLHQSNKRKRKSESALMSFATCLICTMTSRDVMIQACGHIICHVCKLKDLESARGLMNSPDMKGETKEFASAKAIWCLSDFWIGSVTRGDVSWNFQYGKNFSLIGCPICKESCEHNQTNIFGIMTTDFVSPPILPFQGAQEGDIKSCPYCKMKFSSDMNSQAKHEHLFRTCNKIMFQCPLDQDCRINSLTVQQWIHSNSKAKNSDDKPIVDPSQNRRLLKEIVIQNEMTSLLILHLRDNCLVDLTCPHCKEDFQGSRELQKHLTQQDCQSLQKLFQITRWITDGTLKDVLLSTRVDDLYADIQSRLRENIDM